MIICVVQSAVLICKHVSIIFGSFLVFCNLDARHFIPKTFMHCTAEVWYRDECLVMVRY